MTIPKELQLISRRNYRKTKKKLNVKKGYVLHHIDTNLINNDVERYIQWNEEDLIILSKSEHSKLHAHLLHEENRANLSGILNNATGKTWYTNGTENFFGNECPENFYKGKTQGKVKNNDEEAVDFKKGTQILCVETGEIFNSAKEAAFKYSDSKVGNANILMSIRNNGTAFGKHWKRVE